MLIRFIGLFSALLLSTATATGVIGTSQAISRTAFCQYYQCKLQFHQGRKWFYTLNVAGNQGLLVSRESSDPSSRITEVSLISDNKEVNSDLDRQTFGEIQKMALGFISNHGRLERCYALNGRDYHTLSASPNEKTRRIYCDWDEAYTRFVIEADRNYLLKTAPNKTNLTTGPTKLNLWHFKQCRARGKVLSYLPTGVAARCDLMIETKGQQSQLIRAEFQYEIEYVVNGQYVKKLLPEKEYWWAERNQNAIDPILTQSGRKINANISLKIKQVPGRRVISLNTLARLTFANGAKKTAYEPLVVR